MANDQAGEHRKFQLQELDELLLEAYENARIYKQRVKEFHDQKILRKYFHIGQKLVAHHWRPRQNMTATIEDLKMQIGQLANTVSELQAAGSTSLPSQPIPNLRGNANAIMLRSDKELPHPVQHQVS
ncbi:hypothetical protein CR513_31561, partial [Mucuna pruriens]